MSQTASDFLVQRLYDWGVRRIYGYPGDGINGIMGALGRCGGKIEFIQARHEELAAFMACAHAKFTGEVGVCLATSGPGAIHLLNGLYDAKLDHQPVLAIVGQQKRSAIGADYQQEVDLVSLFKDVAHQFVQMASTSAQMRHLVDRAMRTCSAEREVACIVIPNDVQEEDAVAEPPQLHGYTQSGIGYSAPRVIPTDEDLRQAAKILNEGRKVAMLVGAGALGAADEVLEMADLLGAGVAKALLGKAVIPDDSPNCTGSIGLLGTKPSYEMMQSCDTLFMIGSGFPYSEFLPKAGQARGVQIDLKAKMLNLRHPMESALHGDAKLTLRALIPLIERKADRSWENKIRDNIADWWKVMEKRAMQPARPINPQRVFWELSPRLPENCIISADSGTSAFWFARDIKIRKGMMASISGGLATMCPAVPYALAAKLCHPNRVTIALVGDGAMQMLGINGLITISARWKDWSDPRLVVAVLNNGDLNMVTWEQRVLSGDPKFSESQDLPAFDFAAYARQLGLEGIRVEGPDDIASAWDRAFSADRPVVLDFVTDPDTPILPPHISADQAKNMMKSMLKGDVDAVGIMAQSARQLAQGGLPV